SQCLPCVKHLHLGARRQPRAQTCALSPTHARSDAMEVGSAATETPELSRGSPERPTKTPCLSERPALAPPSGPNRPHNAGFPCPSALCRLGRSTPTASGCSC